MEEPSAGAEFSARHWFVVAGLCIAGLALLLQPPIRWVGIGLGVTLLQAGLIGLAVRSGD